MKRILPLVIALGATPLAFANSGVPTLLNDVYVEGELAFFDYSQSYKQAGASDETEKVDGTNYALTVGKEFGDYDVYLNYSKPEDVKGSYTIGASKDFNQLTLGLEYGIPVKTESIIALPVGSYRTSNEQSHISAYASYDFNTRNPALTPFAKVGISRVSGDNDTTFLGNNQTTTDSFDYLEYEISGGLKYDINRNVRLLASATYTKSNDYQVGATTNEYDGYSLGVGARYTFR